MKKKTLLGIGVCVGLFTVAASAQEKARPETEYVRSLSSIAFDCNFKAGLAIDAYKLSTDFGNKQAQGVMDCLRDGGEKGAAAYKAQMASHKQPAIRADIKMVYARWRTYMDSINPTTPSDAAAERAFQDAGNDLKVDIETP